MATTPDMPTHPPQTYCVAVDGSEISHAAFLATLSLMNKVDKNLTRLDDVNERTIREFFQVQGVRVNLIPDASVERRVRRLRNEPSLLPP